MIRKSRRRFSEKIMLKQQDRSLDHDSTPVESCSGFGRLIWRIVPAAIDLYGFARTPFRRAPPIKKEQGS
jgi:hypothetical protein